jgi:hypothetical protein
MHRLVTVLVAPLLVLSPAHAAPRSPGGEKEAHYIPTTLGDKRVSERTTRDKDGEHKETVTELVTEVDRKDGLVVTVQYLYGEEASPRRTFKFRVSEKGIFWLENDGKAFKEPECQLKLPLRAGDNWESFFDGRPEITIKYTTGKEEDVEVPAGKFRAVRIDSVMKAKDFTLETSDWYAPGLGLVKSTNRSSDGGEDVKVLKSFAPGKK